ncbi:hypothetical protein, partial [Parabacteroides faecis]|uniref:hypothetical protein n=1 Tax=Parabacteroides faecis TaxID=1217282 RepID=UPI003A8D2D93
PGRSSENFDSEIIRFECYFSLERKVTKSSRLHRLRCYGERRSARSIRCLSVASFGGDSERRMRSSEAGVALIFSLLFILL